MKETECHKIVTDAEIDAVWGNANFGPCPRRQIISDTVLKIAGGYDTGHTALIICQELGLLGRSKDPERRTLTKKGKRYLYWAYRGLNEVER